MIFFPNTLIVTFFVVVRNGPYYTTTAVQQYVQHIQAANAGQAMNPPPVSFLDGRVLCIAQRVIPGTRYELFERSEFLIDTPHETNLRVCPRARVK